MSANPLFETAATIGDALIRQVVAQPRTTALLFEGRSWTFGELAVEVERLAAFLVGRGLARGDRIAWWGKNHADYLMLLLACARTGMTLVVVNWRLAEREIQRIFDDCQPSLIVVTEDYAAFAPAGSWVAGATAIGSCSPLATATGAPLEALPHVHPDEPFVQLYTSGTTDVPKGVPQSHRNHLGCYRAWSGSGFGIWDGSDRVLVSLPVFHAIGTNFSLYALLQGASVHLLREFSPDACVEALGSGEISRMPLVPVMIDMLARDERVASMRHDRLRTIIYGGSSISASVLDRGMAVFGCDFAQGYAATETTSAGTLLAPADHRCDDPPLRSCGRPMLGIDLQVRGPDRSPLPDGTVGEIALRGDAVMTGYWNRPEETAKVLVQGWYHTGDAGFRDGSGLVTIVGRTRDMMISGGENVYPSEVEAPLVEHPDVLEAAVFGVPDESWGDRVTAALVIAQGRPVPELDEMRSFLDPLLARYKHPRQLLIVPSLPRNPTGKLMRDALLRAALEAKALELSEPAKGDEH